MTSDQFVVAVVITALVAIAILHAVSRVAAARRMDAAEGEIATLQQRLIEAEAREERANARSLSILEAAKPRTLSEEQRDRLVRAMAEVRFAVVHIRVHSDAETWAYASELVHAFEAAGARVTVERVLSLPAEGSKMGDTIHLRGTDNSRAIQAALRAAWILLRDITNSELLAPPRNEAATANVPDVVITVNRKPPLEVHIAMLDKIA